jgi:hypothetical protein
VGHRRAQGVATAGYSTEVVARAAARHLLESMHVVSPSDRASVKEGLPLLTQQLQEQVRQPTSF